MNFSANSYSELLQILSTFDIIVSPLAHGRTKKQTEEWSLCRFLATFYESILLNYPMEVIHSDRPDFEIHMQHVVIGVEVTSAMPPQYANAIAVRNKYYPEGIIEPEMFTWYAPKRTEDEIIDILKRSSKRLFGMGWVGNAVEQQWASGMYDTIMQKRIKLNKDGFRTFDQQWLIIYDNIPQAALHVEEAVDLLYRKDPFTNSGSGRLIFDHCFIETHGNFIWLKKEGWELKVINDLRNNRNE